MPDTAASPKGGTLRTTPLYELLIAALESEITASLVFESHGGFKTALTLVEGRLVKIKPAKRVNRLGEVCVSLGYLSQGQLEDVLSQVRRDMLGVALINSGLMDSSQLAEALRVQMIRHTRWTAGLPRTTVYGLYPDKDFLAQFAAARSTDPLAVIWAAVLGARLDEDIVHGVLGRFEGQPVKLHALSQVARFGFSPKQRSLVNVLRVKPMLLSDLAACGIVGADEAKRVAMVLALTRHADVGSNLPPLGVAAVDRTQDDHDALERAVANTRKSSTGEAQPQRTGPQSRRDEILEMVERIDGLDYYSLLGVPSEAQQSTIQTEFFRQAKRWHPDKLGSELSDLKDHVTRIFSRMSEAHQTLTNPAERKEYDVLLGEGGNDEEEREQVQRALGAAHQFQKAEVCVKRGEWDKAMEHAGKACVDDPEQPEYEAMHAWLQAREVRGVDKTAFAPMLERLVGALKRQPDNVRIRLYRARVLKQARMLNEAIRDFRAVSEQDPSNVEARRELHLHKGRAAPEGGAETGILGRLFKKG